MHLGLSLTLGLTLALSVLLLATAASRPAQLRPEQTVDTGGAQATAAVEIRRWLSETVDDSGHVGNYDSLALEPTAPYTPHISYYDSSSLALKHAWWTSSGWLSETVDSGNLGQFTSLALEPTQPYTPHITYITGGALVKHAWWTPSGWLSETVDDVGALFFTSLALEPAAPHIPHISYYDDGSESLKHAWRTPSGWLTETVDSSGDVGQFNSLALEPTAPYTPHISYFDNTIKVLKHAYWTPSGWLSETVDRSVLWHTSLELEPTSPYTAHISYFDDTYKALKRAWRTPSGWLSETVDSSAYVGRHSSLELEPVAPYAAHISYYDSTNLALKHAWWTPSGWLSETVDDSTEAGLFTSLALEPALPHTPHIGYFDDTNNVLRHAWLARHHWVLFDEAHDEMNTLSWARAQQLVPAHPEWVYFGQLSSTLASDFTLVRNPDAALTPQLLQGYDILVLSAPQSEFTSGESAAIRQFVNTGGGLIVLGECGLDHPANDFLSPYEISFDQHCIWAPIPDFGVDFAVTLFASHPAVAGVSSFTTNWGQSLQFGSGATFLAWTGTDSWRDTNWNDTYDAGTDPIGPFTIVAAYDTGYGRVAAVSDNSFQDDGFESRGNAPLMRALLNWVAGGQQRDLSFVYLPLTLRQVQ